MGQGLLQQAPGVSVCLPLPRRDSSLTPLVDSATSAADT